MTNFGYISMSLDFPGIKCIKKSDLNLLMNQGAIRESAAAITGDSVCEKANVVLC
jgi:hypothetical protein